MKADNEFLEIVLVRHGETIFNKEKKMQGWSNGEILKHSKIEAKKLGEYFRNNNIYFDKCYSSDSKRAIETLNLIIGSSNQEIKQCSLKGLREYYFGQAEELNTDYVWDYTAKFNGYESASELLTNTEALNRCNFLSLTKKYSSAETKSDFLNRIENTLNDIIQISKINKELKILIVTHGLTILGILNICGCTHKYYRSFENLSCTKLFYKNGTYTVDYVNHKFF